MQVTYDGSHSLLIGDFINDAFDESGFIHTWNDWHLIPKSLPIIAPPSVQTNMVEIPGTNGAIDLTSALLGHPLYNNRTGSLEFYVDHTAEGWDWDIAYDTILNSIHGLSKKIILTDSPSHYYEGRLSVNEWKSDKTCCSIVIDYDLAPFKQMIFSTAENWLWNPFDFLNGVIVDRSMFIGYVEGDSSTDWVDLNNSICGTAPITPRIAMIVLGKVSREKTLELGGPPTFEYSFNRMTTQSLNFFEADDITEVEPFNGYIFTVPDLTVGSPVFDYSFSYRFNNTFRDENGDPMSAQYVFLFRPGRL